MHWVKKRIRKSRRFILKLLRGQNPLVIEMPQSHWDKQFEKGYWDFLLDTPPNTAAIVQYLVETYQDKQISILDVGCGNGIIPKLLAETDLNFRYTGTDISAAALAQAEQFYPNGTYINQGMEEELDLDTAFDVVIFSEVLLYGNARKTILAHRKFYGPDTCIIISLYRHWRTYLIWWWISKYFTFNKHLKLTRTNGTAWDVKIGYFNHDA